VTRLIGQSVARIEDRDLLCGKARFVADIKMPGMLHASFVRSPHAHARIVAIDASAARKLPGVAAVLTSEDIRAVAKSDRLAVALPDRSYRQQRDRAILAADETVHVGEAIAMVLASDAYVAEDGAGLVDMRFERLPVMSDARAALAPDAPPVHRGATDNLTAAFSTGYGDVDAAFAGAAHIIKESFWLHRGCANAIECRGCVGAYDPIDDRLTLWSSTQTPLVAARLLAELLGRDEGAVRVIAPEVGGGFGPKLVFYPE
jgi:aerobic carbon-monoxide dehydrogenase large subunit